MEREDMQAVRRVLTRAGITGAALVLSLAGAVPAFAGHGGGATHGKAHQQQQQQAQSGDTQQSGDSQQSASHQQSGKSKNTSGGSTQAGSGGSGGGGANSTSGHNPPGNNGTVKIHDDPGDTSHHNVPHVSCDFYVDFWGFDNGQTLTVSFAGQAPTGKDTPLTFTALNGTSITSPDDAGGGNDFDGELGFQPTAAELSVLGAPQPQQGYHVKLTVTTGEPGGHKYKVFWIQPCPTETGGGGLTGGGETGGTKTPTTHTPGTPSSTKVLGEKVTRPATKQPTSVLGTSATRSPSAALPFTGAEIGAMVAAAVAALGIGAVLLTAGRGRRRRQRSAA